MKSNTTNLIAFNILVCAILLFLSSPVKSQVLNDNLVNFRVETVSFEFNDCEFAPLGIGTGATISVPITFYVNDQCFSKLPFPLALPITFNDSKSIISENNSSRSTSFRLNIASWGNNPDIPFTPCSFDEEEVSGPFGIISKVVTDQCPREDFHYRAKKSGASGQWNIFSVDLGPNTVDFRKVWRYAKGDNGSAALDFGTITSGSSKSHINYNKSITIGSLTNKGYTNKFSGFGNLNNSPDVVYKFRLNSSFDNYAVEISTDFGNTEFDTEIHLLNSSQSSVIDSDDDGAGANLKSLITTSLSPGVYYVVVEGASNNTARGKFELEIDAEGVSPTPGSITQPSPAVFCSGATLPSFPSNVAGGTTAGSAAVTYKWFKQIGTDSFTHISGAISASLTATQAGGTMSGESISVKRKTVLGNAESGFTNTVTLTPTDQLGVIRLASNSPLCSGQVGEFYLTSEDGSSDAGVLINYTLDGTTGTATLDANGKATVIKTSLTTSSIIALTSMEDGGCTGTLTDTATIGIFDAPITLACGGIATGNTATGTSVAFTYSGVDMDGNQFSGIWPGKEIIYAFDVIGTTQNVMLSLTNLVEDLDLFIVSSCDISDVLSSSYNYDDADELIDTILPIGTYYAIVEAFIAGTTGPYTLSLESCGVPSICDNITDVSCFETLTGEDNNTSYFFDCYGTTYNSRVYKIQPAVSGTMNFILSNTSTSQQLYLYNQVCGVATCASVASSTSGTLTFSVTGDSCYFLEVYEPNGTGGTYDIEFDCPAANPCANNVDYVEVLASGDVCIGNAGTYTIQPGINAAATPSGIVTYSLNGGANQTIMLDGAGMATINDTPTTAGNPGSTIVLSKIAAGPCSIELDSDADFNVNGFPTFFVTSSNGPVCSGADNGEHYIQASSSTASPTPYANVTYELIFSGQSPPIPTIIATVRLDSNGFGIISAPPTQAATPSSRMKILSSEINGCVTPGGSIGSITTYDPADDVTVTADDDTYCPGADVSFTVSGTANQVVEYDDTNNGSLPNGSGNGSTKFIVLDGTGQGTITVTNPTTDVRIDIYTVIINPFGSNNNTFPFCKYFYEFGEKYAISEKTIIDDIAIVNTNLNVCETEATYWELFAVNSIHTPNGTINYTLNGVSGTHITGTSELGIIYDTIPTPGPSTLTLNNVMSNGCVVNLTSSVTKTVNAQLQPVIVTSNERICTGETATYTITPAPGAGPNPIGTEVVYTFDDSTFLTVALNASGEATINLPSQMALTDMTLLEVSSANGACLLQVNGGATVDVIPFPTQVAVSVISDICSDGLAEFQITPDPTPSPGAHVAFMLDGVADTLILDASGIASVSLVDETGKANDHTLVLSSIFYTDCDLTLNISDTLTCDMPCFEYQIRNFLEEEAVSYQAVSYIQSSSMVCPPISGDPVSIEYLAGDSISLGSGFTVMIGAEFTADIDPCVGECPCGLVTSPTGSADVPLDVLRWKVNEDTTCVTGLTFDQGNATADVILNVKNFVSGSSGPVFADLSMRIPGLTDRTEIENAIIPTGMSIINVGVYTADNEGAYLVQIHLNYVGAIVEATLVFTPWCITPPPASCAALGRTAQAEAPFDVLRFNLIEDPYCVIGIANAQGSTAPSIKVDVKNFVGGNSNVVEVEVSFVSLIGGGASTTSVNLTSGAGFTTIPNFTYTASNGNQYTVDVKLEYNFLVSAVESDLVETVIVVTPL